MVLKSQTKGSGYIYVIVTNNHMYVVICYNTLQYNYNTIT